MSTEQEKSSSRFDLKKNNRPFIFFVCLLIATALWFIKAMEKNYETTVSLPVRYTNIPKNKILVNPPPSKLDVKIKAQGFTLLRHKIGLSITPVNLNIKPFSDREGKNKMLPNFHILSDQFIPQIEEQINENISVVNISPDTLYFRYDVVSEKKVRVVSRIIANCQNQYFVSDTVKITPSVITVRGPVTIIDTLTSIPTTVIKFNDLSASIQSTVSLEKNSQLDYSESKVTIEIPVSQFTEYDEKINVATLNTPDHLTLITFPSKVNVNCLIAYDKFKTMNANELIVGVDYNDITSSSNTLPVKIIKQPDFIKSLKIQPSQVEFIIKKK